MSLRPARTEEGLQLREPGYACCLTCQLPVTRAPAHGLQVERGYTGPPVPANLCSADRDRNQLFHLNT
jgi:hypothetical protein